MAHVVRIAYKTIYNWIDQGLLDINVTDLPDHGIRRKRAKETRGTFSHGRPIEDRPAEISDRNTSGHFEADTVLSGKRKDQAVATFVERKSRLTIVKRLNGRDSTSMTKAILELANQLGDNLKTFTVDHGKEFAKKNRPVFRCTLRTLIRHMNEAVMKIATEYYAASFPKVNRLMRLPMMN